MGDVTQAIIITSAEKTFPSLNTCHGFAFYTPFTGGVFLPGCIAPPSFVTFLVIDARVWKCHKDGGYLLG